MTRKDYILIAEHLNKTKRFSIDEDTQTGFDEAVQSLCDALAQDNPAFNKEKFVATVYKQD